MTDRPATSQFCGLSALAVSLIGLSACDEGKKPSAPPNSDIAARPNPAAGEPNPNPDYPPSKAFDAWLRVKAGRFYSNDQFTVRNTHGRPGNLDNITFSYVYADDRLKAIRPFKSDITLDITKYSTAAQAKAGFDATVAESIPIADAAKVKLPRCVGSKRDSDNFSGPEKLVKLIPNPRVGQIAVLRTGDFNMYDCKRGNSGIEYAIWTEGPFSFVTDARPLKLGDVADGRAEELAVDYLAALGSR